MANIEMPEGIVIVPEGASREEWMDARGEGVTASEISRIARGGASTWRSILEQKMNGSSFRGNAATRAGSSREAALLDEAATQVHMRAVAPNSALFGNRGNPLHRATPDGLCIDTDGRAGVVEVKSHEHGWTSQAIPADHFEQMQFQMRVTGAVFALYGFEVRDEDDQPPADGATWLFVERDDEMIAWLAARADAFIAWRDAGCPVVDDLPEPVAIALEAWALAKVAADVAAADEKRTGAELRKLVAGLPYAERFGAVGMGALGGFQYIVSESARLDEAAWRDAEPRSFEAVQSLRVSLAQREALAKQLYSRAERRSQLRFQKAGK